MWREKKLQIEFDKNYGSGNTKVIFIERKEMLLTFQ